ncbi:GNAT family N-acetyltransferase [Photobacterium carnosum]|uniref:GNAT family N-acetyltransferase n=1 Tax=Photobacterium carnosum TaxID=2023717 RepID=UPI001E4C1006|nr:GNAT family N-acetyltransferase [Photobacterium carnosum]MCD9555988.1 GNAT family N-acetyltransferase [Photobacterium carnosum]
MDIKVIPITANFDIELCKIIKQVGAEFGAVGEGFGPSDAEVLNMSRFYHDGVSSLYLIALVDGKLVGGCGIAPFNSSKTTCELKKLFLLPDGRQLGLGKKLSLQCLEYAKDKGFEECYLDTLASMHSAVSLYERLGFTHLEKPLTGTQHGGCDIWMLKKL